MQHVICLDLEGVLVPEIWISFAQATGIEELRLTTRDIPDYDALMRRRIGILASHGLTLLDIQTVIAGMDPLEGAVGFLDRLRATTQVLILSDTFEQFAKPLMKKLGWPTLFCNELVIDRNCAVTDYRLRQQNGKQKTVVGLSGLGFVVHAAGDSYNDLAMLEAADRGVLFRPPPRIVADYPQFSVSETHDELFNLLMEGI